MSDEGNTIYPNLIGIWILVVKFTLDNTIAK